MANLVLFLYNFFNNILKVKSKKIAIIIGINYNDNNILNGCVNDTTNIINLLIEHYDYKKENIYLLNDITVLKPTKHNILNIFKFILTECYNTKSILFYYSGHSSNESLSTYDNKKLYNHEIIDVFIKKIPKNIIFYSIFDSCQSENFFNLNYYWYKQKWYKIKFNKKIELNNLIILSACCKYENTIEIEIDKSKLIYEGLFTNSIVNILKKNRNISWSDLFKNLEEQYKYKKFKYIPTPIFSSIKLINMNNICNF